MARFLQIFMQGLQQINVKAFGCDRIFIRHFSKNKHPVKLAYELFEPKGGSNHDLSPLIFLHGMAITKEVGWGSLPQSIADQTKRMAYTLDARNHGDSEWSNEFGTEWNTIDILHFIDKKRHQKVVIIGHSMGGITAIETALNVPEKIEMLFVEDIFVKGATLKLLEAGLRKIIAWKEAEMLIPQGLTREEADKFITQYVLRKKCPQDSTESSIEYPSDFPYPLRKDASGRYVFKVNLDVIIQKLKEGDFKIGENEGIYEGPAYFLYAKMSPFQVDKEKHHILKSFPKAILIPFEGESHFIHNEFRDQFIETVVKYIKLNEKQQ